jgi:RNA polymerase sigma-70 factor (ECF subfamily)
MTADMAHERGLNFDDIVRQEGKKVYNLAYRLCGNQEEAKDIAQETFLRAFEHFHRFRGRSSVFTYLYRVVFNVWKNRLRYMSRHPVRSLNPVDPEMPAFDPPDIAPAPDKAFATEEKALLVRQCLDFLSPEDRYIIILREMEEKSYDEIARILKCPMGTVRSRLARAREALREKAAPHMKRFCQ